MISRGTTPTNTFNVNIDLRDAEVVYITYAQNGRVIFEKTKEDMVITETEIVVELSQEDTLKFSENNRIRIQIRARYPNGDAVKSNMINTNTDELLKGGVI